MVVIKPIRFDSICFGSFRFALIVIIEPMFSVLPPVQYSRVYRKMSLLFYRGIFPLCTFQNQQFWCDHRHPVERYPILNHDRWCRANVKKIAQWLFQLHRICTWDKVHREGNIYWDVCMGFLIGLKAKFRWLLFKIWG